MKRLPLLTRLHHLRLFICKIFNNIGELVYQQTITPSGNGEHSTSVDLAGAGITEGIYLIYMEQSGKSDISKFIVEP